MRLAVIPSDPLEAYQRAGYASWLEEYYNPLHFFEEIYLLSPLEKEERSEFGMKIIPTKPKELESHIRKLDIDAVRAYGGHWACDMACEHRVDGVPVVVSVHDTNSFYVHNSIKKADFVFCMSEAVKKVVVTKYKYLKRVWILPNRVDLTIMHPYPEHTLTDLEERFPSRYRILHVGRKSVEKNLDTLIKALKFLGDEYCLIAIGRGEVENYVCLAREEAVLDRCFFIESVQNNELARFYSFADCMCNPSRREGFGIVLIEALACEAVVVTSDIGPMNEYIKHTKNGLLLKDFENPRALAEMIRWACKDKMLREDLKRKARKSVERFEKRKIDALEANYYEKILGMKGKGYFTIPLWERGTLSVRKRIAETWAQFVQISRRLLPDSIKDKIRLFLKSDL